MQVRSLGTITSAKNLRRVNRRRLDMWRANTLLLQTLILKDDVATSTKKKVDRLSPRYPRDLWSHVKDLRNLEPWRVGDGRVAYSTA